VNGDLPALAGVLTRQDVAQTAASIARVQQADGAVPWTSGGHTDVWNHVEAAMALLVGGQAEAAHRAYDWCLATQRADGSWPMRFLAGVVEDAGCETNMTAYLAVGVWHHWLVRRDEAFLRRCWPAVRRGLDLVVSWQLPFGGIEWSRGLAPGAATAGALVAGSSSVFHALRAGIALSELMGAAQPEWELAAGRLGHALRRHRDLFLDKSSFSMDWYYPVLGGWLTGADARACLDARWSEFVVPGLGARCVGDQPWVTGAESSELVLALDNAGRGDAALALLADIQHLREPDGSYWTGWQFAQEVFWPDEHSTWTAAAVILAADALSRTTPGNGIFRGDGLPTVTEIPGPACGCRSASAVRAAKDA
jgi:hypothetical protein